MQGLQKKYGFSEVFDAQQVFRLILTAMSNPTRVVDIKPFSDKLFGENRIFLALAMTLLDNAVSFSTCGNRALSDDIRSLTLSREEGLGEADYIFVPDPLGVGNAIQAAKCGTLRDPHKSATLIVKNTGEDACRLRLYGPGIRGAAEITATGLVKTALDARDAQGYEYPQGVDFLFVSEDGALFSIPRLTLREAT